MDNDILKELMYITQILSRMESNQRKILELEAKKIGMYEIKTNKELNQEIEEKGG